MGWFSGDFVPQTEIRLPLDDAGLAQGILISEQLRTFAGRPLLLDRHLRRLHSSAATVSIRLASIDLAAAVHEVVACNFSREPAGSDLRVSILVTPGPLADAHRNNTTPTVIVTSSRLPFDDHDRWYRSGVQLVAVDTREIPAACIPRHVKHRNRIHYWLAEQEARSVNPEARALLRDCAGNVCEASTAALALVVGNGELVAPPVEQVLGSISLQMATGLAGQLGWTLRRRPLELPDVYRAQEVLWLGSPTGILPVTRVDDQRIGDGRPGEQFRRLIAAWARETGIDLVRQAAVMAGWNDSESG